MSKLFETDNQDLYEGLVKIATKLKNDPPNPASVAIGQMMLQPHATKLGITLNELIDDLSSTDSDNPECYSGCDDPNCPYTH